MPGAGCALSGGRLVSRGRREIAMQAKPCRPGGLIIKGTTEMMTTTPAEDFERWCAGRRFSTVLADPPWKFQNSTGKVAPEHRRLSRYGTLSLEEIKQLPVADAMNEPAHLYLWIPNALLAEGLEVMAAWGFTY